jgi:hypothetical protein
MRISRPVFALISGALLFPALTVTLKANQIYSYLGNDFTTATSPYTTSDYISGSFTLDSPLPPNYPASGVAASIPGFITSFSFYDGVNSWNESDAVVTTILVATNSSGSIDSWWIVLSGDSGNINGLGLVTCGSTGIFCPDALPNFDAILQNPSNPFSYLDRSTNQGSWTSFSALSTPEPSALSLMTPGTLLLLGYCLLVAKAIRRSRPR